MQILINLSDKTYKDIIEENGIYGTDYGLSTRITGKVVGAIQSGTPLPEEIIKISEQEPMLDKIRSYINHIRNTGLGKKKSLEFIEKYIDGLKEESGEV